MTTSTIQIMTATMRPEQLTTPEPSIIQTIEEMIYGDSIVVLPTTTIVPQSSFTTTATPSQLSDSDFSIIEQYRTLSPSTTMASTVTTLATNPTKAHWNSGTTGFPRNSTTSVASSLNTTTKATSSIGNILGSNTYPSTTLSSKAAEASGFPTLQVEGSQGVFPSSGVKPSGGTISSDYVWNPTTFATSVRATPSQKPTATAFQPSSAHGSATQTWNKSVTNNIYQTWGASNTKRVHQYMDNGFD